MKALKDNLLVQFSVASLVIMLAIATVFGLLLSSRLERNVDLLEQHSASMMSGTPIRSESPFAIENLNDEIRELQAMTYFVAGVGFLVLYAGLVGIVGRGWRTISQQRRELESAKAGLEVTVVDRVEELAETNGRLEKALEELKDTQGQIVQQERMQAMGQMASGVAHDFNNALAPIVFYADMLLDVPGVMDNKAEMSEYLTTMRTSARDAARVVSRLREFYRGPQSEDMLEYINVNEVIESSIELTQPRWRIQAQAGGQPIDIDTDFHEVPHVSIDSSELREVLTNMIMNSVDAMPDGGTITFSTRTEGEVVTIQVSDTGIGMSEEVLQHCMDPFFSTKGERGTGLGLAMAYGTIQRSRGTIDVASEPGKGTTFILRIPTGTGAQIESESAVSSHPPRSLHILAVDDDLTGLKALTRALGAVGHTVDTATNGREGLEKFRTGKYDLVVTDRAMPEMNGDQLAAAIKEIAPGIHVIMITGIGDIMDEKGERPSDVDLLMSKPIGLADLQEALLTLGV